VVPGRLRSATVSEPGDTLRALRWLAARGYAWDAGREMYVRPGDEFGLTLEDAAEVSEPPSLPTNGDHRGE
jgi:hypothetical protein